MKKVCYLAATSIALLAIVGCTEKNAPQQQGESDSLNDHEQVAPVHTNQPQRSDAAVMANVKREKQFASLPVMMEVDYAAYDIAAVEPQNRDKYLDSPSNGVHQVANKPLSTFSIDVDTGSYANVRSYLNMGRKPPVNAIREEAFINYFNYQYAVPENKQQPFSVQTEIAPAPWHEKRQLLRIALKGYEIPNEERKPSNLVFLVDVSGSMSSPNKLPLLVQSLSVLTNELRAEDKVSLVTYAGSSRVVLEPTSGDKKETILSALKSLSAGGGTYGESGIKMAYQQAKQAFIKEGVNRVILATDGDFNVGVSGIDALKEMIIAQRDKGISLTTLGFGRGNYNDAMMEQLANVGQGNHAYIDTLHEARKVLLHQMSGTLETIASDVKIQIEFNPATVKEYRLIGYQNRLLKDEDFNNDKVDAGEIGAGHTVTALYELTLAGEQGQIDDLRYQTAATSGGGENNQELAHVKLRYKTPGTSDSILLSSPVYAEALQTDFNQASQDFQFAAAVASFAQKLKDNSYLDDLSYKQIADIARDNRGEDPHNYRGEFIRLVEIAQSL